MGELRSESGDELLDLVAQVRSHLELQRALGVNAVEIAPVADALARPKEQPDNTGAAVPEPARQTVRPAVVVVSPERVVAKSMAAAPEQIASAVSDPPQTLAAISRELEGCTRCKLSQGRTNVVFGEGKADAALVFVGEAPGLEEDEQGKPFAGAAGQLLTNIIEKAMHLPSADVYICTMVKCRLPEDRKPDPDEIEACRPFLERQLAAINPKIIVALGNVAVKSLLGTVEGITKLRGKWHEYRGIRVMPTYHPAYLLKNPSAKRDVWADIQKVMTELETLKKG